MLGLGKLKPTKMVIQLVDIMQLAERTTKLRHGMIKTHVD